MKPVLTVLGLAILCIGVGACEMSENAKAYFSTIMESCQQKLGASVDTIAKFTAGVYDKGDADEEAKCFIKCIMDEFGSAKDDTKKEIKAHMNEEAVAECLFKDEPDTCDRAYKSFVCFKANAEKIFKKE